MGPGVPGPRAFVSARRYRTRSASARRDRLRECGVQVLVFAGARVDHPPLRVENGDVGGRGSHERAGGAALAVPEDAAGHGMAGHVALDLAGRLTDADGHDHHVDLALVLLRGRIETG